MNPHRENPTTANAQIAIGIIAFLIFMTGWWAGVLSIAEKVSNR